MTVIYDPQETLLQILFRVRGTILPLVVCKPTYWLLQAGQIVLILYDENLIFKCESDGEHGDSDIDFEHGCRLPPLDWTVVQLPASLLVFFVVFYGSNCYARFYELWHHCIDMVNLTIEWAARLEIVFPGREHRELKWQAARLYLSGIAILFNMLGGDVANEDPFKGHGIDDDEYAALQRLHLLTEEEVTQLRTFYGVKPLIVIKWALNTLKRAMVFNDRDDLMSQYNQEFEQLAVAFQKKCITIIMIIQQPVPFAYFHILKVQMLMVLVLIGYSLTCVFEGEWYFSILAFSIASFVLIGLQEIAVGMADPFGSDDMDFETQKLIETTYINVLGYLREDFQVRSVVGVRQLKPDGLVNPLHLEGRDASRLFCDSLFAPTQEEQEEQEKEPVLKAAGSRWRRKRRFKAPPSDDASYAGAYVNGFAA